MSEELNKLRGDKKLPIRELISRSWKYIKPEIWWIVLAFFIVLINVACDVVLPLGIEKVIDNLNDPALISLKIIIGFAVGYILLSIVNQAFLYVESMILQKAGQRIVRNLRIEIYDHIEKMSLDQFAEMPVGSLVTRVCTYTSQMSMLFTNSIVMLIRNALTVVGVFTIMCIQSWQLSLFMLIFVIIVAVASSIFNIVGSRLFRKEKGCMSDINTNLSESLSGMKIIQLFNQEKRKAKEFGEKVDNYRKTRYRICICYAVYRPFVNLIFYAMVAFAFIFGVQLGLTAGVITGFYLYISKFFQPIERIADEFIHIQRALTASERLFNLLDVKPKVIDKDTAVEKDVFEGKIEFRNVWFAYEKNNWVLKDVSFTINPGDSCAFVGATGAGKTTILGLLVRNYEPQKGDIFIDDQNIKDIKVESIRKAVGQMLQDVFLFSGNVRDNITLFDDRFKDDEIMDACKYVNADHFIEQLDNKLDQEVVERGENFSQGQRQLLSFARTILHKPQILLLDEATANIDTETEVLIQESLEKMKNIGTMLVVAHRLSTIQKATQIICLQNGEIVEKGNHQELLKQKGYYFKLYELQFSNQK